MLRNTAILLLTAAALTAVAPPPVAEGQSTLRRSTQSRQTLQGRYLNPDSGDYCYVYRVQGGWQLVDEAAQRIFFRDAGRGRLISDDPAIAVRVGVNRQGQVVLSFFDGAGSAMGAWVSVS